MADPTGTKTRPRGRRSGASDTREKLIAAATRRFATDGYTGTSLRAVAADAGVDQRLVRYFFGSKQQLFMAAVGMPFNPGDIASRLYEGDPAGIRGRIETFLVDLMESPELYDRLTAVVLASTGDSPVAQMVGGFLSTELSKRARAFADPEATALRLNLFGATVVGLILARYVSKIEPLASTPARVVAEIVAPTLETYLVGMLPGGGA